MVVGRYIIIMSRATAIFYSPMNSRYHEIARSRDKDGEHDSGILFMR